MATDLLKRCKAISKEQRELFAYCYVVILIFRRYEICEYERNIEYQLRTFVRMFAFAKPPRFLTNLRVRTACECEDSGSCEEHRISPLILNMSIGRKTVYC